MRTIEGGIKDKNKVILENIRAMTTRQKIRKSLLWASFLMFPITFYYLSPYLIIDGAAKGIITGSFLLFAGLFAISLFAGRVFCGWLCPAGGLQEACFRLNSKSAVTGKRDLIKYAIWTPWVGMIGAMLYKAGGVSSIEPFYQTYHGISVSNVYAAITFIMVAGAITATAALAGKRSFCHYFCWIAPFMVIGRKISSTIRFPSLRLKADKSRCTSCMACTKNCPMSLDVNQMVQKEDMENPECILCGTCADGCPKGTISYRLG